MINEWMNENLYFETLASSTGVDFHEGRAFVQKRLQNLLRIKITIEEKDNFKYLQSLVYSISYMLS